MADFHIEIMFPLWHEKYMFLGVFFGLIVIFSVLVCTLKRKSQNQYVLQQQISCSSHVTAPEDASLCTFGYNYLEYIISGTAHFALCLQARHVYRNTLKSVMKNHTELWPE